MVHYVGEWLAEAAGAPGMELSPRLDTSALDFTQFQTSIKPSCVFVGIDYGAFKMTFL